VTTILLARHGETDWNREGRFQGHADPPLNRTGRAQAVDLSRALTAEKLAAV
jgi:probable phosphoglycerate mutase